MLKKLSLNILLLLVPLVFIVLSAFSAQPKFQEGKNYTIIHNNSATENRVDEFFSYLCNHCYNFLPISLELEKQMLNNNVNLVKNHVDFVGSKSFGTLYAKAFVIAQLLDVEEKISPKIFTQIHVKKQAPNNKEQIRDLFIAQGVNATEFDAIEKSFHVQTNLKKMQKQTADLQVQGVPGFVVGEKYQVNLASIKDGQDFIALVNYLLTLD